MGVDNKVLMGLSLQNDISNIHTLTFLDLPHRIQQSGFCGSMLVVLIKIQINGKKT